MTRLWMLHRLSCKEWWCSVRPWQRSNLPYGKSFLHLLPESHSSSSVVFWGFAVDAFPPSQCMFTQLWQTHPTISVLQSHNRGRANEVAAPWLSASRTGYDCERMKLPHLSYQRNGPLISMHLRKLRLSSQLLLPPQWISSSVPFLQKKTNKQTL